MNPKLKWCLVSFSLLLGSVALWAQTNAPTPPEVVIAPPIVAHFFDVIKPFELFLIPALTVLIQLIKRWVPIIPDSVWPYVGPFLGALIDWAGSNFGIWSGNAAVGALVGGLAIWFHQLDRQGPNLLAKIGPKDSSIDSGTKTGSTIVGLLLLSSLLLITGCGTISAPITKAALSASVALGESFALEGHPQAVPDVKVAAEVVCSAANGTNMSPDQLVAALSAAGVNDPQAKLVVNQALALWSVVWPFINTNQTAVIDYAQALCSGMQAGLPASPMMMMKHNRFTSPHLR